LTPAEQRLIVAFRLRPCKAKGEAKGEAQLPVSR